MKRPLRQLPAAKQRELDVAVEIIETGFAKAIATRRADRLKNGRILKIILFGSYARGDWVHDPVGRYFSDFDIVVVVDHEDLTDFEFWEDVQKRLTAELSAGVTGETGVLRLGFAPSSAFGILPAIVRRFREEFPDVTLHIEDREGVDIGSALSSGDLDLAIVRGPFRHPSVVAETLVREPFMLAASRAHPLAAHDRVALEALADQPFVLFPRAAAPGLHDAITSACLAAGFSPNVVQEAASWSSVVSLVDAGIGVTLAPASAQGLCPSGVAFRPLKDVRDVAELALARANRPLTPVAERFRAIAQLISCAGGTAP